MREFMILIGQIFLISCIQSIVELFVDLSEKPLQKKILNIACFLGGLYLLLQFVFDHLFPEITQIVRVYF
ncbi:MAG: hypothetical protein FWE20_08995 [Defluviitaleaceae bacterium]|nr:hypothetical protein [Defluviitaleaceae bacterium]